MCDAEIPLQVVDLLLAAGADPMIRDKDGVSPLMSAAAQVCATIPSLRYPPYPNASEDVLPKNLAKLEAASR